MGKVTTLRNPEQWLRRMFMIVVNRMISAFRITSHDAAGVLAGLLPLHILIDEDARVYQRRLETGEDTAVARVAEHEASINRWQQEWSNARHGAWTRELVPGSRGNMGNHSSTQTSLCQDTGSSTSIFIG